MKLRSAPLDDVFKALLVTLDDDGGWLARAVRWLFVGAHRLLQAAMLLALRCKWCTEQYCRPISHARFNLTPAELQRPWRQR
jgi:hypothetical protein